MASLFDGENFNANLLPARWTEPNFDDAAWKPATVDKTIAKTLNAQLNEPIKIIQEITPVKVLKVKEGTYIFDLGQNIAGWVKLTIPYNPAQAITFRHGEVLDEMRNLEKANLDLQKQLKETRQEKATEKRSSNKLASEKGMLTPGTICSLEREGNTWKFLRLKNEEVFYLFISPLNLSSTAKWYFKPKNEVR